MKKILTGMILVVSFCAERYAVAQIYDNESAAIKAPMDRVEQQHEAMYADVGSAGDDEASLPQHQRYVTMVEPQDQANDRHFNTAEAYNAVEGSVDTVDVK